LQYAQLYKADLQEKTHSGPVVPSQTQLINPSQNPPTQLTRDSSLQMSSPKIPLYSQIVSSGEDVITPGQPSGQTRRKQKQPIIDSTSPPDSRILPDYQRRVLVSV
jgi:hypothetical protein